LFYFFLLACYFDVKCYTNKLATVSFQMHVISLPILSSVVLFYGCAIGRAFLLTKMRWLSTWSSRWSTCVKIWTWPILIPTESRLLSSQRFAFI